MAPPGAAKSRSDLPANNLAAACPRHDCPALAPVRQRRALELEWDNRQKCESPSLPKGFAEVLKGVARIVKLTHDNPDCQIAFGFKCNAKAALVGELAGLGIEQG